MKKTLKQILSWILVGISAVSLVMFFYPLLPYVGGALAVKTLTAAVLLDVLAFLVIGVGVAGLVLGLVVNKRYTKVAPAFIIVGNVLLMFLAVKHGGFSHMATPVIGILSGLGVKLLCLVDKVCAEKAAAKEKAAEEKVEK